MSHMSSVASCPSGSSNQRGSHLALTKSERIPPWRRRQWSSPRRWAVSGRVRSPKKTFSILKRMKTCRWNSQP